MTSIIVSHCDETVNTCQARMFVKLLKEDLKCWAYDADLAGLKYSLEMTTRGLQLSVGGWSSTVIIFFHYFELVFCAASVHQRPAEETVIYFVYLILFIREQQGPLILI